MVQAITTRFDSRYCAAIGNIRHQVFTLEQHIDPSLDADGRDTEAVHIVLEINGEIVGTGRMLPDGHIGRLAVLKPWRGKGHGRKIIETLIAEARKTAIDRIFLGAQKKAVGFYEKIGFQCFGDPFQEVGIEHVHMEKNPQIRER